MIRIAGLSSIALVSGCISAQPDVVSSINYLQAPIDAQCAYAAIRDADGFSVTDTIVPRGTAQQISAFFNDGTPVQVLVRDLRDGTSEVSVFVRLDRTATPLDRRAAGFAVRHADEAIYRSCTSDGQSYGDDANIILESTEQGKEQNGS